MQFQQLAVHCMDSHVNLQNLCQTCCRVHRNSANPQQASLPPSIALRSRSSSCRFLPLLSSTINYKTSIPVHKPSMHGSGIPLCAAPLLPCRDLTFATITPLLCTAEQWSDGRVCRAYSLANTRSATTLSSLTKLPLLCADYFIVILRAG